MPKMINDDQRLAFVEEQSYRINQTVYEQRFPDWDFARLVFVDSSGPEWGPGVMTYSSSITGRAEWQSAYAKDIPKADVAQEMTPRRFYLAAIGYDFNLEEVNQAILIGADLPTRRANAARKVYTKFMWDLVLSGSAEKSLDGLINYSGVTATNAPADGTGSVTYWVDSGGVGQKTPEQIVRDINMALSGVYLATSTVEMADTILLPPEALHYIAQTPYAPTTMETILAFVMRTNLYTLTTGQPLTIRAVPELSTAASGGSTGRMVAYRNSEDIVRLHLPMPHRFEPVWQSGPLQWDVPGIFRTGGVEVQSTAAFRYIDGISQPPA